MPHYITDERWRRILHTETLNTVSFNGENRSGLLQNLSRQPPLSPLSVVLIFSLDAWRNVGRGREFFASRRCSLIDDSPCDCVTEYKKNLFLTVFLNCLSHICTCRIFTSIRIIVIFGTFIALFYIHIIIIRIVTYFSASFHKCFS